MPVQNQIDAVPRRTVYDVGIPISSFSVNFPIFDNADFVVYQNGVQVTGFTVSATYMNGVSLDAVANFSPAISGIIMIVGKRSPRRVSQLQAGVGITAATHNAEYNQLTAMIRELYDRFESAALSIGVDYLFDPSVLGGDPGAGMVSFDDALASLTMMLTFSIFDRNGVDVSGFLASWDDAINPTFGTLKLQKPSDPSNFVFFNVVGALTVLPTHVVVPVNYLSSGGMGFEAGDGLTVSFSRAGDAGTGGGSGTSARRFVLRSVGGTAQAITALSGFALASVDEYDSFVFLPAANITGPGPTLNVDGTGALPILSPTGAALAADEIHAGRFYEVVAVGGSPPVEYRIVQGYA